MIKFLFSTIIYLIFAGSMFVLGEVAKSESFKDNKPKSFNLGTILIVTVFTLFSGLRYGVGVDYFSYLNYYLELKNGLPIAPLYDNFEPLFVGIASFLAYCKASPIIYFAFWALLQVTLFYYGLKDRKFIYPFIGLVLILGGYYLSWMNGIRQVIVACAFVMISHYIVKHKFIKYLLAVLLCTLMHRSAIILILFYFIPIKDYFKNKYLCIGILLLCAVLGQMAVLKDSLDFIEPILSNLGYDSYADNFTNIIESESSRTYGPRRFVLLLTNILIIWFSPQIKEKYGDKYFIFGYNMFFIYICLSDLLSNVSYLFLRPLFYLNPFVLIMTGYLLAYLSQQKTLSLKIIFIIALIVSCSYMAIECVACYNLPDERSMYKSILFNEFKHT